MVLKPSLLLFWLQYYMLILASRAVSIKQEPPLATDWSPRNLGRLLQHCLSGTEAWHCLGAEVERLVVAATLDNSTWHVSDYLSIEPQEQVVDKQKESRSVKGLTEKLIQLAQGRALRLRLPRQISISNAIDDFGNELGLDQGRKKKDKDKHMAMMGGMIMMATVAQMFLGKVILIAGSAFIMAKIALLISLLGSLKKGSTGHSGSPEHVIVASGGHSHESGWHRSMPPTLEMATTEESQPGHEQEQEQDAYYAYEMEQSNRRQLPAGTAATTTNRKEASAAIPRRGFL